MEGHSMAAVIAILVLILLSAYFSATETAFTSINRIRLKNTANDGDRKAKRVLEIGENFDKLLSTILIGNNIVNITMTSIATVLFVSWYGPTLGPTLSTVVITLVVLVFGEITPKSVAKEQPERFAMFSAPFLKVLVTVFTPLAWIFGKWKVLVTKMFHLESDRSITEEELLTLVEEAETEGGIDEEQSELIQNAIEFNDLEAYDVLTPRVDLVAIEIDTPKEDVAALFRYTGFSRIPVYEDDLDNILGILNQKDFHNYIVGTDRTIDEFVKPVVFVAASMKIAVLLKKMQTAKTHLAVIVDEYGGTEGIVTMEDIIEELVGEIYDEHDGATTQEIIQLQDGSYRVQCSSNLSKFFDFFDVEEELDVTTVNGWIVVALDDLPKVGDSFEYDVENKRFKVKVTKADDRRALEANILVEEIVREDEEN